MKRNLYRLDTSSLNVESAFVTVDCNPWHRSLAHLYPDTIMKIADANVARNLDVKNPTTSKSNCFGCALGKAHRAPIPKSSDTKSKRLLELVHSDVNGPLETSVIFVDDFSNWTVSYTMKANKKLLTASKSIIYLKKDRKHKWCLL